MTCAFHPKSIVPSSVWRELVGTSMVTLVEKRAQATLSLQCGGCHSRRDQRIPQKLKPTSPVETPEDRKTFDTLYVVPLLKDEDASLDLFQTSRSSYLNGSMDAPSFLARLDTELLANPLTKGNANGLPCDSFVTVLHSLGVDAERECTLHAAYLRRFPDCYSLCCKARHCYRCHITGFHDGKTCEEYQASKATVEDVVPCPKCGLQLTKGDGCSSVSCVCGSYFDWSTELRKVHDAMSAVFESQVLEASGFFSSNETNSPIKLETITAHLAAFVTYQAHAGGGDTDEVFLPGLVGGSRVSVSNVAQAMRVELKEGGTGAAARASLCAALSKGVGVSMIGEVLSALYSSGGPHAGHAAVCAAAWAGLHADSMHAARSAVFETGVGLRVSSWLVDRERALPAVAAALTEAEAPPTWASPQDALLATVWKEHAPPNARMIWSHRVEGERCRAKEWSALHWTGLESVGGGKGSGTKKKKRVVQKFEEEESAAVRHALIQEARRSSRGAPLLEVFLKRTLELVPPAALESLRAEIKRDAASAWHALHDHNSALASSKAVDVLDRLLLNKGSSAPSSALAVGETYEKLASAFADAHPAQVKAERARRFEAFALHLARCSHRRQPLSWLWDISAETSDEAAAVDDPAAALAVALEFEKLAEAKHGTLPPPTAASSSSSSPISCRRQGALPPLTASLILNAAAWRTLSTTTTDTAALEPPAFARVERAKHFRLRSVALRHRFFTQPPPQQQRLVASSRGGTKNAWGQPRETSRNAWTQG